MAISSPVIGTRQFSWKHVIEFIGPFIIGAVAGATFASLNPIDDVPTWLSSGVEEEPTAAKF